MTQHFLDIDLLNSATLQDILTLGEREKAGDPAYGPLPLEGRVLALIFEKPSTRTRVSFEVAMKELGGDVVVMDSASSQLGRGETVADTARVLSRYVDAVMLRTTSEEKLHELAQYADVPVINGLTDQSHPCQIMADIMTIREHKGGVEGLKIAWLGDGNNVAASFIHGAAQFGYALDLACPKTLFPRQGLVEGATQKGANVRVTTDPARALNGADVVVTDTWVSMGDDDAKQRLDLLGDYQVNGAAMAQAKPDAIFMHCLPAHRDEEVTAEVIDGPQSVVFDEAENRLHAQKGVLLWCLGDEFRRSDAGNRMSDAG